ncbi:hypothetical protein ACQEVB_29100 [Pseudonocardia sp. CA-107938]|uniref:hypothetical protein n=1 Tax=Pseudonocardia sp. CA-107938 TaxID=3240021 RepID=UPI003D928438
MSQQPQGPGWWQAPDGRWYPPRPPQGPPPYQQPYQPQYQPQQYGPGPNPPPPPRRSNRGCVIAAVVVGVLVLVAVGFGAWALYRVGSAVSGVTAGAKTECPSEAEVSTLVGSPVKLKAGVSVVVASGCSYLSDDRATGVDVQITSGPALIADEQFKSFESDAGTQDVTSTPIPVGSRGRAYGGEQRSAAIAVDDSRLVEVEVFAASAPIGDRQAAAVALLQRVFAS